MTEDAVIKCLLSARLKLGGVAWSILRDSHAAEDILQEIFVKALARKEQFDKEDYLLSWARVTCQNAAIDLYRQQINRKNLLSEAALDVLHTRLAEHPDEALDDAIDALHFCLNRLPEKTRMIMHDRYKNDVPVESIASKFGRSLNAIYQTIARTHHKLRECMQGRIEKGLFKS